MSRVRMVEGVEYAPFLVRFRTVDGKRRRVVRWSPSCGQWVRSEVARELGARGDVVPGSDVKIRPMVRP